MFRMAVLTSTIARGLMDCVKNEVIYQGERVVDQILPYRLDPAIDYQTPDRSSKFCIEY